MPLIDDYVGRLKHYASFEFVVLPDIKNAKNLSFNELKEREGDSFLKNITENDFVILLDENGKHYKSTEFADFLERKILNSTNNLVFVIGGAFGFSPEIYARANEKIALSQMTFSHQIIRILFAEQLYRAFTIMKGESYHH